jgi:hypothetical protein
MQQAALEIIEPSIHAIEQSDEQLPWFIIQSDNTRVRYKHDWITDFFGGQDNKQDGLGLSFKYPKYIQPGTRLDIGIPLPESVDGFKADVITASKIGNEYEVGIWLHTSSDADLELLLRSCEYSS